MEASSETGMRHKVKGCLGSWKESGNSTHAVRLGYQRALQSVEGVSDPRLDWASQKLKCIQNTGGSSSAEVHTALFVKRSPPIVRGRLRDWGDAPELGRRSGI